MNLIVACTTSNQVVARTKNIAVVTITSGYGMRLVHAFDQVADRQHAAIAELDLLDAYSERIALLRQRDTQTGSIRHVEAQVAGIVIARYRNRLWQGCGIEDQPVHFNAVTVVGLELTMIVGAQCRQHRQKFVVLMAFFQRL